MNLQEARDLVANNGGAVKAKDSAGNRVEISAFNGDEVTYRVIRRGRPKFLKGNVADFTQFGLEEVSS